MSACMVQASEAVQLLGVKDMAHAVTTMPPLSLLVSPSVNPVVTHHLPSHSQISAATFFENKHGRF